MEKVRLSKVFVVAGRSSLFEDGVSKFRFCIVNNDFDSLKFLDNGEILKSITTTDIGKKRLMYSGASTFMLEDDSYCIERAFPYFDDKRVCFVNFARIFEFKSGVGHLYIDGKTDRAKMKKQKTNFTQFSKGVMNDLKNFKMFDEKWQETHNYKDEIEVSELLDIQNKLNNILINDKEKQNGDIYEF